MYHRFMDLVESNRERNQQIRLKREERRTTTRTVGILAGVAAATVLAVNRGAFKD